jgi:hypothetical protein
MIQKTANFISYSLPQEPQIQHNNSHLHIWQMPCEKGQQNPVCQSAPYGESLNNVHSDVINSLK